MRSATRSCSSLTLFSPTWDTLLERRIQRRRSSVVTHNLLMFLVLVVGLPLKLHSSQGLFFPKTAILMLRERFLIAENTCEKICPRFARTDRHFARTDRHFAPLRYKWAVPLLLCRCRPCIGSHVHGHCSIATSYLILKILPNEEVAR